MRWITLFADMEIARTRVGIEGLFRVRVSGLAHKVLVTRRKDGTFKAFSDACPHKLASFSMGGYFNTLGEIVCPLHHYSFEIDTGSEQTGMNCPDLVVYQIRESEAGGLELLV
jgi:nitrite reductase/ring-hydroxylating ferredoxin subunit